MCDNKALYCNIYVSTLLYTEVNKIIHKHTYITVFICMYFFFRHRCDLKDKFVFIFEFVWNLRWSWDTWCLFMLIYLSGRWVTWCLFTWVEVGTPGVYFLPEWKLRHLVASPSVTTNRLASWTNATFSILWDNFTSNNLGLNFMHLTAPMSDNVSSLSVL